MFYKICISVIALQLFHYARCDIVGLRNAHKAKGFDNDEIRTLAGLTNTSNLVSILENIAIERVVGTRGHLKVKNYIKSFLSELNWHVESNEFEEHTPVFGKLQFENIIGTLNPNAYRFLVIACHYDSKYFPNEKFIGATDSAVPCSMMLNLIYVMRPYLEEVRESEDVSLKLVFFDGEEAFQTWGPKDSIYGARHLARKLERESFQLKTNREVSQLMRWDLMVLLDLLGTPDPTFYSITPSGQKWFTNLVRAENQLTKLNLLETYSNGQPEQRYFRPRSMNSFVEDDHIPFMQRGVPILHVIPLPFPDVWHKKEDNMDAVDLYTVENLNKIFRIFVAGYLHLNV